MPEWLVERGIGEIRYALVQGGEIVEARISLDGVTRAGSIVGARLVSIGTDVRNAIARDAGGNEYLLPRGAPGGSKGSLLNVAVTREAIPGSEPWKRPLGKATDEEPRAAEPLRARQLSLPAPRDELADAGWADVIEEVRSGLVRFPGGELRISPTPAMTLIDVDGYLPPDELAIRGAAEAAKAICRLDIGGSIGVDLPTVTGKAARQAAAAAIDEHLPQPFERTAVNGFGFVQIVRQRTRASLVELAQDRAAFEARALLRRVAFEPPGSKRLVAHPAVIAVLEGKPEWLAELSRQIGGSVELRRNAALPISAAYAENC